VCPKKHAETFVYIFSLRRQPKNLKTFGHVLMKNHRPAKNIHMMTQPFKTLHFEMLRLIKHKHSKLGIRKDEIPADSFFKCTFKL
jgi:hypothetical protein